jgi:ComF family protein
MIHQLKYKNNREIGYFLGELFGLKLMQSSLFEDVDYIVPVPLHRKKLRKRGYNQSEVIATGIGKTFGKELNTNNLFRKEHTSTQTRKSRFARWENVSGIFDIRNPEVFSEKHILLIDDVITTGSTLEACAASLKKADGIKLSLVALAYTL